MWQRQFTITHWVNGSGQQTHRWLRSTMSTANNRIFWAIPTIFLSLAHWIQAAEAVWFTEFINFMNLEISEITLVSKHLKQWLPFKFLNQIQLMLDIIKRLKYFFSFHFFAGMKSTYSTKKYQSLHLDCRKLSSMCMQVFRCRVNENQFWNFQTICRTGFIQRVQSALGVICTQYVNNFHTISRK